MSYSFSLFVVSRRHRAPARSAPAGEFVVFVLPCLDEAVVIGASIERLLSLPGRNFAVLVVDDGSTDATAAVVRERLGERVWLLSRQPPDARQGKGKALNAAVRHLCRSDLLAGRSHAEVVVAVLDADGRLALNALYEVLPYFSDASVAAVQVGVRMNNTSSGLLARMQDFEFVVYTDVFQRARQRLGSTGLGGNGQFVRLSALESLGPEPWSDCLTEDLDLGIRLLVAGWQNRFCASTHVSQQAVTSLRLLVRQRARWFQGHVQCWSLIPVVLRSTLSGRAANDLVVHLTSPALTLLMSVPAAVFLVGLVVRLGLDPSGLAADLGARGGLPMAIWYVFAFGLAPFFGFVYWLGDRPTSAWRALALGHLYCLYCLLWFPASWVAVAKAVRGRRGWAKTARTPEQPPSSAPDSVPTD